MKWEKIDNELFFAWVKEELAEGRSVRFRVKGFSMLPMLRTEKDEVVPFPYQDADPQPWDVVLFRYKGRDIMHRIIRKEGDSYTIQGDGVLSGYEKCSREDIVGVVRQVIRPSGRIVHTDSRIWRWESKAWRSLGILRYFPLKFLGLIRRLKRFGIKLCLK